MELIEACKMLDLRSKGHRFHPDRLREAFKSVNKKRMGKDSGFKSIEDNPIYWTFKNDEDKQYIIVK